MKQNCKYGAWANGKKIETLPEEKVQQLRDGTIDPREFINASDSEWQTITSFCSNLFDPSEQFK